MTTQRDYGNREDRKQARLKYTVETKGIEWFRAEVQRRVPNVEITEAKELKFTSVEDNLGWHEQGDGKWYLGVYVAQGRVKDDEGPRYRTVFREIAKSLKLPFIITANTNLYIVDVPSEQRAAVIGLLAKHGVPFSSSMTATRRVAHACVALPTCGLSLSESERVFGGVLDGIDPILRELNLQDEPILIRMTGCPNGCARPYNADIAFVGRAPGKYAMFVGGSIRGDRLAGLEKKVVALADIPKEVRPMLEDYAKNRKPNERFTDFWGRTRVNGEAPTPEQFHIEFAEREAKKAAANGKEFAGEEGLPGPVASAKPADAPKATAAPVIKPNAAAPAELAVRESNTSLAEPLSAKGVSVKFSGELNRFIQSRLGPNGLYDSEAEYLRDLVRRDFEREEQRQWTWRTHEVRKGTGVSPDQPDFLSPLNVNVVVGDERICKGVKLPESRLSHEAAARSLFPDDDFSGEKSPSGDLYIADGHDTPLRDRCHGEGHSRLVHASRAFFQMINARSNGSIGAGNGQLGHCRFHAQTIVDTTFCRRRFASASGLG